MKITRNNNISFSTVSKYKGKEYKAACIRLSKRMLNVFDIDEKNSEVVVEYDTENETITIKKA